MRLLARFHRKLRYGLQEITCLAAAPDDGDPADIVRLRDLFVSELALHDLDEEASLMNRLRRVWQTDRLKDSIVRCTAQHEELESVIDVVAPRLDKMVATGVIDPGVLRAFHDDLGRVLLPHLHLEETEVFPLARLLLSRQELDEIYQEMIDRQDRRAARRPAVVAVDALV